MAMSISSAARISTPSSSPFRPQVYSSLSTHSAVLFRNCNTGPLPVVSSMSFHKNVWTAVISRFRSSKQEMGFFRLNGSIENKVFPGLAASGADSTAMAETAETEELLKRELVSTLLSMVEGTDRGALLGKEEQANVAEAVCELEKLSIPEPLQSPLIFGDWDVSYSSNPTSPGGGYRSWLGRLIFKTKEMTQTIRAPDIVVNMVRFSLFGFVPGEVVLRGKLLPLDNKLVQVDFEPPSLQIGPFKFKYGKDSTVKLAIIYLDKLIRLGRGSRGTVFVFTRR